MIYQDLQNSLLGIKVFIANNPLDLLPIEAYQLPHEAVLLPNETIPISYTYHEVFTHNPEMGQR